MERFRWCGVVLMFLLVCVAAAVDTASKETLGSTVSQSEQTSAQPTEPTTTSAVTDVVDLTTNSTMLENDNCTSLNASECQKNKGFIQQAKKFWHDNLDMIKRTLYVLMGVTAIVIIYFGVKYWRLRRRKTKKYGIVTAADNLELQPLDMDDDDEDMTVFESNGKARLLR